MLFGKILGELNYESLALSREASRSLKMNIDQKRIYWIQKIRKYLNKMDQFQSEWKMAIRKTPTKILKKISDEIWNIPATPFVTSRSENFFSPIGIAAACGDLTLFIFLSEKTLDINSKNQYGWTPLHFAAHSGQTQICKYIIDRLEDKIPYDNEGTTPHHYAAVCGHFETYQALMNMTNQENPTDNVGMTPLHCAAVNGYLDICKLIMEKLEDKNPRTRGFTPLHVAAMSGQLEICQMIIDFTGQVCPLSNYGNTPFYFAAKYGRFAVCNLLCKNLFKDGLMKKDWKLILIQIPLEMLRGSWSWFKKYFWNL